VLPESTLRTWTSASTGVRLAYPARVFAAEEATDSVLRLRVRGPRPPGVEASLWLTVSEDGDSVPEAALRDRSAALASSLLGLTEDDDPDTIIPTPRIGSITGVGGSYRATAAGPEGPARPASAVLAAARNGRVTAVLSYVIVGTVDPGDTTSLRAYLSPVLTTFEWPT
jgi:hypothetical protein